jgi:hypothetical protein
MGLYIQNVPGLDDRNLAAINGFEADIRPIIIDRGASGLAIIGSIEPEFHSRDETSGAKVVSSKRTSNCLPKMRRGGLRRISSNCEALKALDPNGRLEKQTSLIME